MNPELKAEFGRGLLAAWLTAKGDPRGAFLVSGGFAECKRSFFAVLIGLPGMLALSFFRLDSLGEIDATRYLLAELITYAIGCTVFPLAVFGISRQIGLFQHWARFVTVYNWASILILALTIPVTFLINAQEASSAFGQSIGIMMLIVIVGYDWRLARLALMASPMQAAMLTAFDLVLSFSIESMSQQLALGAF